jgi:2-haloacid dehalogenase
MVYSTLLFDLDHTLFDFDASESAAFAATLAGAGATDPGEYRDTYAAINKELWASVEQGELSPNQVRTLRFERLIKETGLDADPHVMADHYVTGLGAHGDLFPGALDVVKELTSVATLAIVSNGIGEVARAKIGRLGIEDLFAAIVISSEVGVAKPDTGIFDIVMRELDNPDKASVLMIGDSLSSDIRGGNNFGIDTCWYAPNTPASQTSDATHRITNLTDILAIVTG